MTLTTALRGLPHIELVELNLSSSSAPSLLLRTLAHHCDCVRSAEHGGEWIMRPKAPGKTAVVFLDEVNLPKPDSFGSLRLVALLRQLVERAGFWRSSDHSWISLQRIQFVAACNPPEDAGRSPLPLRFLRHAPLLFVDFPDSASLKQIYSTFTEALLRPHESLRPFSSPLAMAMVSAYFACQTRFSPKVQAHYILSPRDLSRWLRSLQRGLKQKMASDLTVDFLGLLWLHEG